MWRFNKTDPASLVWTDGESFDLGILGGFTAEQLQSEEELPVYYYFDILRIEFKEEAGREDIVSPFLKENPNVR